MLLPSGQCQEEDQEKDRRERERGHGAGGHESPPKGSAESLSRTFNEKTVQTPEKSDGVGFQGRIGSRLNRTLGVFSNPDLCERFLSSLRYLSRFSPTEWPDLDVIWKAGSFETADGVCAQGSDHLGLRRGLGYLRSVQ